MSVLNAFYLAVVQSLSHVGLCDPVSCSKPGFFCPSLSPWVCSNSCPLNQWCYPTISSSFAPFSSCPQFFPPSGYFPVSQFFASDGQSISFSISPFNEYSGLISFRIDWFDLLASLGDSQKSSPAPQFESILRHSAIFMAQRCVYLTSIHDYWKNYALTIHTFVGKVMSLLFHTLSLL